MFNKTSRLDRLSLWGTGAKAGLAAIAAAFMLSTLSPVSAQQPTPEVPPVVEAPVTPPADAAAPPVDAPVVEPVVEEEVVAEEARCDLRTGVVHGGPSKGSAIIPVARAEVECMFR